MPNTTALFFIPFPPADPPFSTANLISQISRLPSAKPLPPYTLDHRLLISTPSLLPGSDISSRRYTQFLSLSQLPGKTFIGTTSTSHSKDQNTREMAVVTIPGTHQDELMQVVMTKMSPLWAMRGAVRVDNGLAVSIQQDKDGQSWQVRIGEVRVTAGQGVGRVRGVIVQIDSAAEEDDDDDDDDGEDGDGADVNVEKSERKIRAFLEAIMRRTDSAGSMDMESVKSIINVIRPGKEDAKEQEQKLVQGYMELLRFSKTI